ncbi:MAG: exosortase A [Azoarcus sp.]|jgi:exosortase A|nr:exosortase A [Azoarcus sp.]
MVKPVSLSGFRTVALTLAATLIWCVLWYARTAGEIAAIWWRSDTFGHGLVVLPFFAWAVWRRREAIGNLRPQPAPWLAVPMAAAGLLWLLGELASVAGAAHTGFVTMSVLGLTAVLGRSLARALLFPLLFLFFALPVGEFMLPSLMAVTADFVVATLRFTGIPVYQEGLHFVIPGGSWSVVEACSGIRYLIASLMLGALYAWLNYATLRKRLVFMTVAFAMPLLANWVRAYLIVLLGHFSSNRLATGVDHLIYGWVFFGIVIVLMFWAGRRWADSPAALRRPPADAATRPTRWARLAPLALTSAFFVVAHDWLDRAVAPYSVHYELPAPAAGWRMHAAADITWRAHYEGARGAAQAVYGAPDGGAVLLQTAFYADQRDGADMLAYENGLIANRPNQAAQYYGPDVASTLGPLRSARLMEDGEAWVVWQWYVVDGKPVLQDWEAKLRLAFVRLSGRRDAAMVFVLATPDEDHAGAARLARFVAEHEAGLRALFGQARAEWRPAPAPQSR